MSETNFQHYLAKKAYEISYALFRIAAVLKRRALADHLENQALLLLTHTIGEDYMKSSVTAAAIEYLVKFGEDLGIVNGENGKLVTAELRNFNAAIAEFEKSAKIEAIDLRGVFSKHQLPEGVITVPSKNETIAESSAQARQLRTAEQAGRIVHALTEGGSEVARESMATVIMDSHDRGANIAVAGNENGNGNGNNIVKVAMRQSAILERIRQNNNCRLKDIQEWLTDVSERTIRYDLQNLIGQGLVERLGNGGPATYYRVR